MKLNKTQQGQLSAIAKEFDTPIADVTAEFERVYNSKQLASRKGKEKSIAVMRKLMALMSKKKDMASFGGKTEDVIIRVEQKEEPTEFKTKAGKKGFRSAVYCVARSGDSDFFAVMTLWGDANEVNPQMVIGKTYATQVVVNGNQLSMNKPETLTSSDTELPQMSEVIKESYPVVELDSLELNISEDWNDLKLIPGIISGAWSKETANGNMMGFLKIIDEDGANMMVAKFSRMYEQVDMWDDGSFVYVLGQITPSVYDESTGEVQYEASAWGNLIIPIDAFEKESEEDEDDEEFEDLEDDDDWDSDDEFEDNDEDETPNETPNEIPDANPDDEEEFDVDDEEEEW